jgi:hypothetical protein
MIMKTQNHTSFLILFGSSRQGNMRNPVESVTEPKKLDFLFAVYLLVISITFFLQHQLQHQIDRQWQMTAFSRLQEQWQWDHLNRLDIISLVL